MLMMNMPLLLGIANGSMELSDLSYDRSNSSYMQIFELPLDHF